MIRMTDTTTRRDPTLARAARTLNKHTRWAAEMRAAGWLVALPHEIDGSTIICRCGADMDRSDLTVHPDRDEYDDANPLRTRGQWEEIGLMCGYGHTGSIVTADHKGQQRFGLFGDAVLR